MIWKPFTLKMKMIDKNTILKEIANDNNYRQICRNIVYSQSLFDYQTESYVENDYLTDELYSEFLLSICEIDEDKLIELYNKQELNFYLLRIIVNQYKSNSSRYFRQIKKKYTKILDYNEYNEENDNNLTILSELEQNWLVFLEDKINKLHWYDKTIFSMYIYENLSMKKISEKVGINESSIKSTIRNIKNYLKEVVDIEMRK